MKTWERAWSLTYFAIHNHSFLQDTKTQGKKQTWNSITEMKTDCESKSVQLEKCQNYECRFRNAHLFRKQNDQKKKKKLFCQWMDVLMFLNKMITSQAGNSLDLERTLCNQCSCARLEKWMIMETSELMDLPVRSLWLSKWEASYNGRGKKQNHFDN